MTNRLLVGRPFERPLTGSLPRGNRLLDETSVGIVNGNQFRISIYYFGKTFLQSGGYLPVILAPLASKQ
jgi:hypothetical protein